MIWVLALILCWTALVWGRLIVGRLRFAYRLKRICAERKLRLVWVRPCFSSVFVGRGKIDFVIDERVGVAMLTTPYRKVAYWINDDGISLVRRLRRYTSVKSSMRGFNETHPIRTLPHYMAEQISPDLAVKAAVVYPVPFDVADCRGSTVHSIGSGEELPGGFQFNTRSHFFDRLVRYADTGDLQIWAPREENEF